MSVLKEILFELRKIRKELHEINSKGKVIKKGGPVLREAKEKDMLPQTIPCFDQRGELYVTLYR